MTINSISQFGVHDITGRLRFIEKAALVSAASY